MFVLSPFGPTFDLETKKRFFCRVSDYALSDGGNRFSQFGLLHTVQKRHYSVRRSNLTLAAKQAKIFHRSHFERSRTIFGARPVGLLALRKVLLTGKFISSTGSFFFISLFLRGKFSLS